MPVTFMRCTRKPPAYLTGGFLTQNLLVGAGLCPGPFPVVTTILEEEGSPPGIRISASPSLRPGCLPDPQSVLKLFWLLFSREK